MWGAPGYRYLGEAVHLVLGGWGALPEKARAGIHQMKEGQEYVCEKSHSCPRAASAKGWGRAQLHRAHEGGRVGEDQ